ncbi:MULTISPECIES: helix-turn-helix domain-containing protein [unclassified Bacillus (in: firmicutes)]|uniref:helix-turn-helix domain-containing protein n=1 Tax=unclassified Bacillus (in: firmicutes) TaxID=185979 RepID=UPI00159BBF94|nr:MULTISPECIES: helix-turn-helix domain-containing protein [unclassified Bacillus (in: firmicutes)]
MKIENIEYICRLVFESCKVPVTFFNQNDEIVIEFPKPPIQNPIISDKKERFIQLICTDAPSDFPVLKTTNYLENYLIITLPTGSFIAGPCLYKAISDDLITGILNDNNLSNMYKNVLISYYQQLPTMSQIKFMHTGLLIYYMIFQQKLDVGEVIQKNVLVQNNFDVQKTVDANLSVNRQNISLHHDPAFEKHILQAIREGRMEVLSEYTTLHPPEGIGVLSKKSQLRNEKNLAICGISLFTRASIDGGLQPELAYTMSDLYIQRIEDATSVGDINNLTSKAFIEFCDRVRQRKQHQFSNPVLICQDYIFNHIYEKVTIADLAKLVHLNPAYLSRLFKNELGIPLGDYIQREKVEESKKLLKNSTHTLLEICSLLNFNDQSYFIKVFKKFTGTTPKQFKNTI